MKLSIGTPPFEIFGIADTGSDTTWTQCCPCKNCYKQKRPLFAPTNSSTYKAVLSASDKCRVFEGKPSIKDKDLCAYDIEYGDGSSSSGLVLIDKFTLRSSSGKPISLGDSIVFGCGYENSGIFSHEASGIIGLGGSEASLISQMSSLIGGKFAYCLNPTKKSSKMHFGANAIVSGVGVVSTPMWISDGFYSLKLKGLSIRNKHFYFGISNVSQSSSVDIVMDSGCLLTYLPPELYFFLVANMKKHINQRPISDPNKLSRLCYNNKKSIKSLVPSVTVHFLNANLSLKWMNTFIRVADNKVCLGFASQKDFPLFGSLAQLDFLIGHDLGKKIVSFKPTDCTQ